MKALCRTIVVALSLLLVMLAVQLAPAAASSEVLPAQESDVGRTALVGCLRGVNVGTISYAYSFASVNTARRSYPNSVWCFYDNGVVVVWRSGLIRVSGRWTVVNNRINVIIRTRWGTGAGGGFSWIDATISRVSQTAWRSSVLHRSGSLSAACVNNTCFSGSNYRAARFTLSMR